MPSVIRGSDNLDSSEVLGPDQTIVDMSGTLSTGTTYWSNDTTKPIFVTITSTSSTGNGRVHCVITDAAESQFFYIDNGGDWDTGGGRACVTFIVPPTWKYYCDIGSPSIATWLHYTM